MAVVDLRYARALDEVVSQKQIPREEVKQQLADLGATYDSSATLREVLENPSVPQEQKVRLLDAVAARLGLSNTVRNFAAVMIAHERMHELNEIGTAYLELADRDSRVAEAEVTSARPLGHEDRGVMEASISRLSGSARVRATYREDPALLGGAIVKVGSTVYDGSVRGQLEQMKRRMIAAAV